MGKRNKERELDRIEKQPCGCQNIFYKGGEESVTPCAACGILRAAQQLSNAANSLAAVADFIRRQQNAQTMGAAVQEIMEKKSGPEA